MDMAGHASFHWRSIMVRRSPEWTFLMTREQYLALAVSLRRTGHEQLAHQWEILFKIRTPYVEAPPLAPGHDGGAGG
jgi:hypothetical protein